MKKLHFSLMAILIALFAMVSFTACSSDDDDTPSTEAIKTNIVGMWQIVHISGWTYDDTEDENLIKVDQDVTEQDSERLLFKSDGTYKMYWYLANYGWQTSRLNYNYEIYGNKIELEGEGIYTVLSLKGDVVVLQYTMDEGPQYKTNITCKRVD